MATLVIHVQDEPTGDRHTGALLAAAAAVRGVTVHDLAAAYPDLHIDPMREAALLAAHDTVVLQFPMRWYAVPTIIKRWIDEACVHGFSSGGDVPHGKRFWIACNVCGPTERYGGPGRHAFNACHPLETYCAFLERTARSCGMHWEPPFVVDRVIWERLGDT